jgi:hypothetical protein
MAIPNDPPELQIFKQAEIFFRAFWILKRHPLKKNRNAAVPGLVMLALVLELYFKCLITMQGNRPKRTHDLQMLFKQLSSDDQNQLRAYFAKELSTPYYSQLKYS